MYSVTSIKSTAFFLFFFLGEGGGGGQLHYELGLFMPAINRGMFSCDAMNTIVMKDYRYEVILS